MVKKPPTIQPLRRAIFNILSYIALGADLIKHQTPYWDHSITGKLGSRSQWAFDVHKYHLKNHKYARRA